MVLNRVSEVTGFNYVFILVLPIHTVQTIKYECQASSLSGDKCAFVGLLFKIRIE